MMTPFDLVLALLTLGLIGALVGAIVGTVMAILDHGEDDQ